MTTETQTGAGAVPKNGAYADVNGINLYYETSVGGSPKLGPVVLAFLDEARRP